MGLKGFGIWDLLEEGARQQLGQQRNPFAGTFRQSWKSQEQALLSQTHGKKVQHKLYEIYCKFESCKRHLPLFSVLWGSLQAALQWQCTHHPLQPASRRTEDPETMKPSKPLRISCSIARSSALWDLISSSPVSRSPQKTLWTVLSLSGIFLSSKQPPSS